MSDHNFIYLEPECCACPATGQVWCQHPDPVDCEHGNHWEKYIRFDKHEDMKNKLQRLLDETVDEMKHPYRYV